MKVLDIYKHIITNAQLHNALGCSMFNVAGISCIRDICRVATKILRKCWEGFGKNILESGRAMDSYYLKT